MKINDVKVGVQYAFSSWGTPTGKPVVFTVTDIVVEAESIRTYSWQRRADGTDRTRNVRKVKGLRRGYGSEEEREVVVKASSLHELQPVVDRYQKESRQESLAEDLQEALGVGYAHRSYHDHIEVRLTEDEAKALLARLSQ